MSTRKLALGMGFFALLLVPGLVIGHFVLPGAATLFFFGAIPIAAAYFGGAPRASLPILMFMVTVGTLARIMDQNATLVALLMASVGAIIGMSARRGLTSPVLNVGIVLGFLIMSPPTLGEGTSDVNLNLNPTTATALLLTLGGLWAWFISAAVRKKGTTTTETSSRTLASLIPYALALAIATGVSTFFLVTFDAGSTGAWLILTIYVVLKPEQDKTIARTRSRIGGTFLGAFIAYLLLQILGFFGLTQGLAQITLALILISVAMAFYVPGPYWVYVTFLTPGVVLLDSNAVSDQTTVDGMRVIYTLLGIALALGSAFVIRGIAFTYAEVRKVTPDQSH